MKLIYRGITYEHHPSKASGRPFQPVREPRAAHNLTYRGVTYRVAPHTKPVQVPIKPVSYKLNYRGITYLVNRNAQGEVTAITQLGRHFYKHLTTDA